MKIEDEKIQAAFVVITMSEGYELGLAHKGVKGYSKGYGKPYCIEYPGIEAETYDDASDWADMMNREHYGHTQLEAARIVASTMFI